MRWDYLPPAAAAGFVAAFAGVALVTVLSPI